MPKNMNKNDHVLTMDQEVEIMTIQMKQSPKRLHQLVGKNSCCIFRVPQGLVDINKEAYRPRIVSIGPYHYGNKDLEMIQELKWTYLNDMITRIGKPLKCFMDIIVSMELQIRESYSESIDCFSNNELAKMMVLDGIFLIELFRKVGILVSIHQDDPIFRMLWVISFISKDLMKVENQIPFFVLQKLFDESGPNVRTLPSLILKFFNYAVNRQQALIEYESLDGKHLLDLFRKSFINTKNRNSNVNSEKAPLKLIRPATKLVIAGVKCKANHQANSFLDIDFRNGFLLIPKIEMNEIYSSFILNCVAFEQCYVHCSKDVTTYVMVMGCLMNTSTDVSLLMENEIIENYLGADKEILKFFQDAGKDVVFNGDDITDLFSEVNDYCKNGWHVGWAGFKHTYFESPWASISAFAAFMLLSFAALQTFYTVYQYYHK